MKPKSGGPSSKRTKDLVDKARKKNIWSPIDSARKIAKLHCIAEGAIGNVLKDDLGLCPFKYQCGHLISEPKKVKRLE